MKSYFVFSLTKLFAAAAFTLAVSTVSAQEEDFWSKVRFGGSLGAAFGTGYTDVSLAPGAIYQFNRYVALGAGVQGSYVHQKDYYDAYLYGGSVIGLFNPIPEVQLSVEVEQLRVNLDVDERYAEYYGDLNFKDRDFWNTALFVGAGYAMDNVTIGVRYNVLFNDRDLVYSDALMPFVRVYF